MGSPSEISARNSLRRPTKSPTCVESGPFAQAVSEEASASTCRAIDCIRVETACSPPLAAASCSRSSRFSVSARSSISAVRWTASAACWRASSREPRIQSTRRISAVEIKADAPRDARRPTPKSHAAISPFSNAAMATAAIRTSAQAALPMAPSTASRGRWLSVSFWPLGGFCSEATPGR